MNLDTLERRFITFLVEGGADPEHPAPLVAWKSLITLSMTPAAIDDPGDDFLRFEASTEGTTLWVSLSRELTQANGDLRGAVGCDFRLQMDRADARVDALVESSTEPEHLPLDVFVERVEATRAFRFLMASPLERAARWSNVTQG